MCAPFTNDLDLLIQANLENEKRAVRALKRFGRPTGEFEATDFTKIPTFISFATNQAWFDLMTTIPGVEPAAAFANQTMVMTKGLALKFISLAALRANKQATGRLKDLLDLENLPPA